MGFQFGRASPGFPHKGKSQHHCSTYGKDAVLLGEHGSLSQREPLSNTLLALLSLSKDSLTNENDYLTILCPLIGVIQTDWLALGA